MLYIDGSSHYIGLLSKLIEFFTSNVCILLCVNYTTTIKKRKIRNCGAFRVYSRKIEERINKNSGDK